MTIAENRSCCKTYRTANLVQQQLSLI